MTCKEQNKTLNDKIECNINQYKVDRLNAEISAFSSGDLNKYEFLTRKDLKYKPNALDKARFELSPLGKTFNTGLDKTAQGYQEEGVIKLLKDIRDGLVGAVNRRPDDNRHNDNNIMIIDIIIIDMMMDLMMMNLMMMDLMMNLMMMDLIQRHMIRHIHQMMKMILKIKKI